MYTPKVFSPAFSQPSCTLHFPAWWLSRHPGQQQNYRTHTQEWGLNYMSFWQEKNRVGAYGKNYAKKLKAPVFSRATQDAAQKGACEKEPFPPPFQAPSQNTCYMQDSGLGWEVVVAWGAISAKYLI